MKIDFYPKLAADGIRKNKRLYVPYILTCIGMVAITYILNFLTQSQTVAQIPGARTIQELMEMGGKILTFFSVIFLFYTNSFLIRRRKKEFGLYNILGMGKGNIAWILVWETIYVMLLSLGFGLLAGIGVSKLAELGLVNMMRGTINYTFSVSVESILVTAASFALIFVMLLLNALRQVWFFSAIALLRSENAGEKPPKANWLLGILGLLLLIAAYWLAVTIEDPIMAMGMFMVAVLMVIAATYLLMIAGSVWFCRILQKRKSYYYKPNHFVSVSSMVYRMKRNGAGLASICILATMVLVMISSTSTLFVSGEDVIRRRYPREINCQIHKNDNTTLSQEEKQEIAQAADAVLQRHGAQKQEVCEFQLVDIVGIVEDGVVNYDTDEVYNFSIGSATRVEQFYLVSLEDYNARMGTKTQLSDNEVLVYDSKQEFAGEQFGFSGHPVYQVKEVLKECFSIPDSLVTILPTKIVVVPDLEQASEGLVSAQGDNLSYAKWSYFFDTTMGDSEDMDLQGELTECFREMELEGMPASVRVSSRAFERLDFYSLYGGLFYLGILLSIVFLVAAVLIIYYKQISEGYEDQSRFEIMQKVGMTKKDIRASINSQLLTVFFLPLVGAGLHLTFAFPMIEKLLQMFNMNNRLLFIGTTVGSYLLFALFYAVVYRTTSNAYYQIVSGARESDD